jgi:hypothetical protein
MNRVDKHKLAFIAVPKTACSSFKHMFYEMENGAPFKPFRANGRTYNIHHLYPSRPFEQGYKVANFRGYFKFAIVRDPVKRLLSAYSNRVVHYKNLARWALGPKAIEAGVAPDPNLLDFLRSLETYRKWSGDIRHHTDPAHVFLGKDLSIFDAVYPIERIDACEAKLSEVIGEPVTIPHVQTGGPKLSLNELDPDLLARIVAFYAEDYDLLGEYYEPPVLAS